MKYFIITGASRGLGEAIAEQLIKPEHHLICISRHKNEGLVSKCSRLDYLEFDLGCVDEIGTVMEKVFSKIDEQAAEGIYLINNAAVIAPLCGIEQGGVQAMKNNLHVNLLAPMLMTASFIRCSQHFLIEKRVLNISSISAQKVLPGLSVYSASKAGLDAFSKCVGAEQGEGAFAVKVASVWPGMLDTGLQEEARNADKGTFASVELFKKIKDRGMLTSPSVTAKKIIGILLGDPFIQGSVVEELTPLSGNT